MRARQNGKTREGKPEYQQLMRNFWIACGFCPECLEVLDIFPARRCKKCREIQKIKHGVRVQEKYGT